MVNIIKRWWQSKGFGIQSKTDFHFLYDVIREQRPYYAYDEMRREFQGACKRQIDIACFLLRLANYLQTTKVVAYGEDTPLYRAALKKGCMTMDIQVEEHGYWHSQMLDHGVKVNHGNVFVFSDRNSEIRAVVVTDISSANNELWSTLATCQCISYDMYHTGLLLVEGNRYQEHYKIFL